MSSGLRSRGPPFHPLTHPTPPPTPPPRSTLGVPISGLLRGGGCCPAGRRQQPAGARGARGGGGGAQRRARARPGRRRPLLCQRQALKEHSEGPGWLRLEAACSWCSWQAADAAPPLLPLGSFKAAAKLVPCRRPDVTPQASRGRLLATAHCRTVPLTTPPALPLARIFPAPRRPASIFHAAHCTCHPWACKMCRFVLKAACALAVPILFHFWPMCSHCAHARLLLRLPASSLMLPAAL